MPRQYPRFLFSDPQNTKSKGPFIVHTIIPKCIFRVVSKDHLSFDLQLLPDEDSQSQATNDKQFDHVFAAAHVWLTYQLSSKEITL